MNQKTIIQGLKDEFPFVPLSDKYVRPAWRNRWAMINEFDDEYEL